MVLNLRDNIQMNIKIISSYKINIIQVIKNLPRRPYQVKRVEMLRLQKNLQL